MTDFVFRPNCSKAMERRKLERSDGGELAIDLCFPWRVIWFDAMESPQLAARAVIELLQMICGAPIDLARQDHCEYCHAPIAALDADAVERAARVWGERAGLRAKGRAIADRDLAQLRNVGQWNPGEGGDLLLHSIGMIG